MNRCIFLLAVLLPCMATHQAMGQSLELGIFNVPSHSDTLELRVRPIHNVTNGQYTASVFTVRTPAAAGITLEAPTALNASLYGFTLQDHGTDGQYDYFLFAFIGAYTVNWDASIEYPIATLISNGGCEWASFEIVNNEWTAAHNGDHYQELNANQAALDLFQAKVVLDKGSVPPSIRCPGNKTVNLDKDAISYTPKGADWEAIGIDNCPGFKLSYEYQGATSGKSEKLNEIAFQKGLTSVNATVTDVAGLKATCTFSISVGME